MSFINDIVTKSVSSLFSAGDPSGKKDPRAIESTLKAGGYVRNRANMTATGKSSDAVLEYPSGAGGDTDDYVFFYINEYDYTGDKSGWADATSNRNNTGASGNMVKAGKDLIDGAKSVAKSAADSNTGKAAGTVAGWFGSVGSAISTATGLSSQTDAIASTLGLNGDVKGIQFNPPRKRSPYVIALYMPHSLQTNYGMQYGEVNADGVIGAMLDAYGSTNKVADAGAAGKNAFAQEFQKSLGGVVANIVDSGRAGSASWKDHLTKTVRNPRKETSFLGVGFRTFQFDFLLTPSNEIEAGNILAIIDMFKTNMHPELSGSTNGNMHLRFPNDFDIEFRHKGTVNGNINKVLTSVLENMSVQYAPNNMWTTHEDGMPTAILLSLHFREIEPLNRGHIRDGF